MILEHMLTQRSLKAMNEVSVGGLFTTHTHTWCEDVTSDTCDQSGVGGACVYLSCLWS